MNTSQIQPSLLGKMNEREVLRLIQSRGPCSRAEVSRLSGISAPTVSKAVASLLDLGLVEEEDDDSERRRGRPAKLLRMARTKTQAVGVMLDAEVCQLVVTGLDGRYQPEQVIQFPTPERYSELLHLLVEKALPLLTAEGMKTQAIGMTMPGLIDYREERGILSPNMPITNGHQPSKDFQRLLKDRGIETECLLFHEPHALCLAEKYFGDATRLNDFAMIDMSTGVGLGVYSGGQLLRGHRGLAGEVGHITVISEGGKRCGCGNHGCLETVASDAALASAVSISQGHSLEINDALQLLRSGAVDLDQELDRTCQFMGIGLAVVINLFNPATLFVYAGMFDAAPSLFDRVEAYTRRRALNPSANDCRLVKAKGNKLQGAVAGVIEHLTESLVPDLDQTPTPGAKSTGGEEE